VQYDDGVIRADRVIPAVLGEIIRKAPLCPEKVAFAWRSSVGAAVDRVTKVRLDNDRVLHVTAADSHWAREVRRSSHLILSRLKGLLGNDVVVKISCSVGQGFRPGDQ
jgi:Dna[CI] antecedent DciA-like protein